MYPNMGSSRADFPDGSVSELWDSIQAVLALPEETRLFVGHDYGTEDRGEPMWGGHRGRAPGIEQASRAGRNEGGVHRDPRGARRSPVVARPDAACVQVNLCGGALPAPEADGHAYFKIPANRF
ncbi:hypothetical protein MWU52_01240 [Jannaschia sp. S6380]|uniref:hypothetical protein n=1 Tax=Jannaschia sp. S6380 TaxID=2926408 RepID=UPI001FF37BFA|nr:hypothetical protein [Jannaschia sp. S6380]MCK0166168.1 hypothetical protein [Jannaschia sp. S6380]